MRRLMNLKWLGGQRYPLVVQSWRYNRAELATFFKYPPETCKLVYTINMIELPPPAVQDH